MANAPKRSASDALKESHGDAAKVTETDAAAAAAKAEAEAAEAKAAEAGTDAAEAKAEKAEVKADAAEADAEAAVAETQEDAEVQDSDDDDGYTVVDGGKVKVTVRSDVAMLLDGNQHVSFPRGTKLKVTKAAAERGIALEAFDK